MSSRPPKIGSDSAVGSGLDAETTGEMVGEDSETMGEIAVDATMAVVIESEVEGAMVAMEGGVMVAMAVLAESEMALAESKVMAAEARAEQPVVREGGSVY